MPKLHNRLRVREAADLLGVVPNTVRNWGHRSKIPEHRQPVNDYRLFRVSDLDRLLRTTERSVSNSKQRRHKRPR